MLSLVVMLIASLSFQLTVSAQEAPAAKKAVPAAKETAKNTGAPTTTVEFKELEWDFGEIVQGDKVTHVFQFTNTGSEPLILNSAKGSCGCTVPEWPREPILPGEEGEIKVTFNSKGKKGKQTKSVTLTGNTDPNPVRLLVKAQINVVADKTEPVEGAKEIKLQKTAE